MMVPDSEFAKKIRGNGMQLSRKSFHHYSLAHTSGWLINIYPGNCRLYADPNKPAHPFLKVPSPWTIPQVVNAAIVAQKKHEETPR